MRILWLKTELLHPVDKGGRIRTYQMLRELRKLHEITYLTLDDGTAGPEEVKLAEEYCHQLVRVPHRRANKLTARFFWEVALNAFSSLPYFLQKYRSEGMRREVALRDQAGAFDVLVCDFLVPSVNLSADIHGPTVLFQHNVEAEIWRRHAEVAGGPLRRAYFTRQWKRTLAYEGRSSGRFDRVVAVSRQDRVTFERDYGLESVEVVDTGIDVDYFRPSGRPEIPKRIVFTGSMDWLPNVDGMQWFVNEIMPAVHARHPDATLAIVGRDPNPAVRALGERYPYVTVTGTVPDVRPWIEEGEVYVVPLRIGGGTRLKIYEAMALARPVVSTSIGMEGLPVCHGEELRVADEAATFAHEICQLLDTPQDARALGRRAADRVRRDFSWANVSADFARILEDVCASSVRVDRGSPHEEGLATCV